MRGAAGIGGAAARPTITAPPNGAVVPRGAGLTLQWTPLVGVSAYLFEAIGPNRAFSNPNGTSVDPGSLSLFVVSGTGFTATVPLDIAPGTYQARVIGLLSDGRLGGSFSDAVTLVIQ